MKPEPTMGERAFHYNHKWRGGKKQAILFAEQMSKEHGVDFNPIKCRVCKRWHVGKVRP